MGEAGVQGEKGEKGMSTRKVEFDFLTLTYKSLNTTV